MSLIIEDEGYFIVATDSHKICISNLRKDFDEYQPVGPEALNELTLLKIKGQDAQTFRVELSGCFSVAQASDIAVNTPPSIIRYMESQGANKIHFFKYPDKELFDVFAHYK